MDQGLLAGACGLVTGACGQAVMDQGLLPPLMRIFKTEVRHEKAESVSISAISVCRRSCASSRCGGTGRDAALPRQPIRGLMVLCWSRRRTLTGHRAA
jgi:hypothetical protein